MPPSVVAVMAHPDDIEIHIAGTLMLLRERGCDIHFVTMCRGDVGSVTYGRDETARIRFRESANAAAASPSCDIARSVVSKSRLIRPSSVSLPNASSTRAATSATSLPARARACIVCCTSSCRSPSLAIESKGFGSTTP